MALRNPTHSLTDTSLEASAIFWSPYPPPIQFIRNYAIMAIERSRTPQPRTHGCGILRAPLQPAVAVDILERDGNAVDAAIAANAMGVCSLLKCGSLQTWS